MKRVYTFPCNEAHKTFINAIDRQRIPYRIDSFEVKDIDRYVLTMSVNKNAEPRIKEVYLSLKPKDNG